MVSSICWRLDGIPLALELAAARLSSMSLVHLNERLDQRFRLLTGGSRNALPRQQTLQAMVDWSFGLLNPQEKALLRRVSVFAGGFEFGAAEAVAAVDGIDSLDVIDLLGSLVDKSLVIAERSAGSVRYRLLETIADYASQELLRTDGEEAVLAARDRHAAYYLAAAETLQAALEGHGQGAALKALDSEWDNLRAAFVHLEAAGGIEATLRLGIALNRFFLSRGRGETLPFIRRALDSSAGLPDQLVLTALVCLAQSEGVISGPTDAQARKDVSDLSARAFELSKNVDDAALRSEVLGLMAGAAYFDGDDELARTRAAEALALAEHTNHETLIGIMTMNLANFMRYTSSDESRRLHLEALDRFKRAGDAMMASIEEHHLAGLCLQEDDAVDARWHLEESVRLGAEVGAEHFLVVSRSDLCAALLACGEIEAATSLVRQCLITARRLALRSQLCGVLFSAACCATWNGDLVRSARLHGAADAAVAEAIAGRVFGWTASEDRVREEARAKIREELPPDVLQSEYLRGASLSVAQAVDLALGRSDLD